MLPLSDVGEERLGLLWPSFAYVSNTSDAPSLAASPAGVVAERADIQGRGKADLLGGVSGRQGRGDAREEDKGERERERWERGRKGVR